jgi:hypothetical protein
LSQSWLAPALCQIGPQVNKTLDKKGIFEIYTEVPLNIFTTVCLFLIFLGSTPNALGYEDKPFEFHVVVPDSVLFVLRGVEYSEFELKYTPGDFEVFINGAPVFGPVELETEKDCMRYFVGVESAQDRIRQGIPCDKIKRWYKNEKNVLLLRASDMIQLGNLKGYSDLRLSYELFKICMESPIAPDIIGALVLNEKGYIEFEGVRYSTRIITRIPDAENRANLASSRLPFGEMAFIFSKQLVESVSYSGPYSKLIALSQGGGGLYVSGDGLVSQGRAQLKKIQEIGHYVKGPIPENTFR